MSRLYEQWAEAFSNLGMCHIQPDTCCKILAVYLVYGGSHSDFTHNMKLVTDAKAAQRRLHIEGSESPDPEWLPTLKQYVKELEEDAALAPFESIEGGQFSKKCRVKWANDLFEERYGINELLL